MRKERKHFTPEEKVAILRRHLVDKVPVSELCEELGLRPTGCCAACWWKRYKPRCVAIPSFASNISIAVIRSRREWPRWRRRAGWRYDSTGCCAPRPHIRRSSHREQLAGGTGRRKLDRKVDWALSHPVATGCSHRRIMVAVVAESMFGGTSSTAA
jgi:hypothetical protein